MNITTTYKTNANGTGQILAKGGGKQRTTTYDHEFSPRENHRQAAASLAHRMGFDLFPHRETIELDKGKATFHVSVGR